MSDFDDEDISEFLADLGEPSQPIGDPKLELVRALFLDRPLAHRFLFAHRHPLRSPDFHDEIIAHWHSPDTPFYEVMAFREGAKSTIGEEATIIMALFGEFKNGLVIGANQDLADERLHAIKNELENNEVINDIFGDVRTTGMWAEGEIVLRNRTRLMSHSKGSSMRGTKFEDFRPDYLFVDDLEDKKDVRSPEAQRDMLKWVRGVLIPAMARGNGALFRMTATPLDKNCVAETLAKDPDFIVGRYPCDYVDEDGVRQATWPESLSLQRIDRLEATAIREGLLDSFNSEYRCQAETNEVKPFKADQMRIEPRVQKHEPVYCMFDPARTVKATSATTGFAAWSWVSNRLIIWDSWAKLMLPDQIIQAVFDADARFNPVFIGMEEDGLHEFIMQPLRQEQVRRGISVPLRALRAPKSKLDFIRGLQPYFASGEAVFACELPDLKAQLLNFPTGKIDAPNALAYAQKMHPGALMFEGFGGRHIAEDLHPLRSTELYVAFNATGNQVSAILAQMLDGALRIYRAWVSEGEPLSVVPRMLMEINVFTGRAFHVVTGHKHYDVYNNVGLNQALRLARYEVRKGSPLPAGRAVIENLLGRTNRAGEMFMVDAEARYVLNAMQGGYARPLDKQARVADEASDNVYRLVMEGLEAFAGLLNAPSTNQDPSDIHYGTTAGGSRYITARRL